MMFNRQSAEAFATRNFHNSLSCKFNNCNHINPPDYRAVESRPWVRRIHIFKQDAWSPSTVVCIPWLMCLDSARRLSSVMSGFGVEKGQNTLRVRKTCCKDVEQLCSGGPRPSFSFIRGEYLSLCKVERLLSTSRQQPSCQLGDFVAKSG